MEELIIVLVIAGLSMVFGNKDAKKSQRTRQNEVKGEYKYLGETRKTDKSNVNRRDSSAKTVESNFKTREELARDMKKSMNVNEGTSKDKRRDTVVKDMMKVFGFEELDKNGKSEYNPYANQSSKAKQVQELHHDHERFIESTREAAQRKIEEATMETQRMDVELSKLSSFEEELHVVKLGDFDVKTKSNKSLADIRKGFIYSEILGKPVSMKK